MWRSKTRLNSGPLLGGADRAPRAIRRLDVGDLVEGQKDDNQDCRLGQLLILWEFAGLHLHRLLFLGDADAGTSSCRAGNIPPGGK